MLFLPALAGELFWSAELLIFKRLVRPSLSVVQMNAAVGEPVALQS